MDSHMQVLATPSSIVHNTEQLYPYLWNQISVNCLFFRQWWRDVASGADRHLYIITPHAQRERGKVIDRGVHIYIYMSVVEKKIWIVL